MVILLTLIIILLVYAASPVIKRISLIVKLRALAKRTGARVRFLRSPFLSLVRLSARTEITVETDRRIYLIRLVSSQGRRRIIHFADGEYVVSFTRIKYTYATGGFKGRRPASVVFGDVVNKGTKVRVLPKHVHPRLDTHKPTVDVILFNPSPITVTCVSSSGTRINVAHVEDTLHGAMIFTGSSFIRHVERDDEILHSDDATAEKS